MENNKRYGKNFEEKIFNVSKYILEKQYGTTLTFEELNNIIGEDLTDYHGNKRFKRIMSYVKNTLIHYGYVVRSVMNVGYYILKPNQVSSYTYRNYIIKPLKSFDKAKIILANVDKSNLSSNELNEHKLTNSLNENLMESANEIIKNETYISLYDTIINKGDNK